MEQFQSTVDLQAHSGVKDDFPEEVIQGLGSKGGGGVSQLKREGKALQEMLGRAHRVALGRWGQEKEAKWA